MSDDPKLNSAIFESETRLTAQINARYGLLDGRITLLEDKVDGNGKADIGIKAKVENIIVELRERGVAQRWQGYVLVGILLVEIAGFALMLWLYSLPR